MKTLAMIKMEKNFIAHNDKGYPRRPYIAYSIPKLLQRLNEEAMELIEAWQKRDLEQAKLECGDISNIVDFIFECLAGLTK